MISRSNGAAEEKMCVRAMAKNQRLAEEVTYSHHGCDEGDLRVVEKGGK